MVLQDLLAGGVEYVQDSQPSDADAGEIWLDTSVDPSALKIYDASSDVWDEAQASNLDAPVSNIQDELQSGRTRELLMLLQDKPVPEVQDPLNLQSGLSDGYIQSGNDYILPDGIDSTATTDPHDSSTDQSYRLGLEINPNYKLEQLVVEPAPETSPALENVFITDPAGTVITSESYAGSPVTLSATLEAGTTYLVVGDGSGSFIKHSRLNTAVFPYTSNALDITAGVLEDTNINNGRAYTFISVRGIRTAKLNGYIADQFAAPTTAPADFKAWNAIQAQDVTVGGSSSANPVEFEILDSTDTVLNSTRIPKARIAEEPFTMRNRVYSESAVSNGQADYQIATTGDGGHFGIPILTVVSVKKNGSVLDSANWSFDGDTTVTIDTSAVTIASGDTIDIKYDFDVFDSTLQPRAYLSREDTSETSPSISHFRYEYVI